MDIIYYTLFPWENAYSSVSLSLTRELAKKHRVFYINHPMSYKDWFFRRKEPIVQSRLKAFLQGRISYEYIDGTDHEKIIAVQAPPVYPINPLPNGAFYNYFYRKNQRRVLKAIQQVISDYKLKNYLYLNCFNPYYAGILPEPFKPLLNVYQCIDDMETEAYVARHGARIERQVIQDADIVLVTSSHLKRLKQPLNSEVYELNNAVDYSIFRRATDEKLTKPAELAGLQGKIIGYTGNLDPNRVDYPLLKGIALQNPDKYLVLVGPLNTDEYKRVGLDTLDNVILTGAKPIDQLPAFLQHMDVLLIPFLYNQQTESIYPLKINEYLASGKPVVSSSFSPDIQSFRPYIYLSTDKASFLSQLELAIQEKDINRQLQRVEVAKSNTWAARAKRFWEIVEPMIPHHPS